MNNNTEQTELINLGAIQQMQGNFDIAESYYNKAFAINAQNVTLLNNRGMLFYQQNCFTEALADFEKAIELDEQNATAWLNLGNTQVLLNEPEKAFSAYKQSLQLRPEQSEAWEGLAKLYMLSNDFATAEECWVKAINMEPSDPELLLGLAQLYLSTGKPDDALQLAELVLSQDPQNGRALKTAGLAHLLNKNFGLAIGFLTQYLNLFENDATVRNHLALALLQIGEIEAAAIEFEWVLKLDAGNHEVRLNTGVLDLSLDKITAALEHFDIILEQDNTIRKAQYYRGTALAGLGRKDEAAAVFNCLVEGGDEWAQHAARQLELLNTDI